MKSSLSWRTSPLFPYLVCVKEKELHAAPVRITTKMTSLEISHKIKWKQINWVNTVPEVSVERKQVGHPRNKDRCSCSRTTGRYRNRAHCYGGFNQPTTLITIDYAPSEACKTFITVMQHIKGWTLWLLRWMTWHRRQMCNFIRTSTFDYDIQASF